MQGWNALGFALAASFAAVPAVAQEASLGETEYVSSCAACHGVGGEGDGVLAGYLNTRLPDLTRLQAENGGVFPVARVYGIIENSVEIGPHGTTDMPAWGMRYKFRADRMLGEFASLEAREEYIKFRILALVEHLSTLQAE
ncbi:MAG: c-type cytochrome [Paracoccaceae bacterium]|nr:c-type cytochrome [Paracoccaceae bacterium]